MATRPTLTVVGKGEPVVADNKLADCLRKVLALAEAGEIDGLFLMYEPADGSDPEFHIPAADPLRLVALAELHMDVVKAAVLGYEVE